MVSHLGKPRRQSRLAVLANSCLLLVIGVYCVYAVFVWRQAHAAPVHRSGVAARQVTDYHLLARQDALAAGIPPALFVRQIQQESGFNPNAHGQAGEIGIAQFWPPTAAGLGINPHDPVVSLRTAAHLVAAYYKEYGRDYAKALTGYNCGGGCLARAVRLGGAAAWGCYIPLSTRAYIFAIMREGVCR